MFTINNNNIYRCTVQFIRIFITNLALANTVFASVSIPSTSNIEFEDLIKFENKINDIGVTFKILSQNINIFIDEAKTLNSIPVLEMQGVVSKLDANVSNIAPLSVSVVIVGISSTIRILHHVFEYDRSLNKVHVNGYLMPIGSEKSDLCFSFDYERNAFEQLDLSILTPRQFVINTSSFTFDGGCMKQIQEEVEALHPHV